MVYTVLIVSMSQMVKKCNTIFQIILLYLKTFTLQSSAISGITRFSIMFCNYWVLWFGVSYLSLSTKAVCIWNEEIVWEIRRGVTHISFILYLFLEYELFSAARKLRKSSVSYPQDVQLNNIHPTCWKEAQTIEREHCVHSHIKVNGKEVHQYETMEYWRSLSMVCKALSK